MYACMCVCLNACMRVAPCARVYAFACACVYVCMCGCVSVFLRTHVYTYVDVEGLGCISTFMGTLAVSWFIVLLSLCQVNKD